jgi:hypothetical protein
MLKKLADKANKLVSSTLGRESFLGLRVNETLIVKAFLILS